MLNGQIITYSFHFQVSRFGKLLHLQMSSLSNQTFSSLFFFLSLQHFMYRPFWQFGSRCARLAARRTSKSTSKESDLLFGCISLGYSLWLFENSLRYHRGKTLLHIISKYTMDARSTLKHAKIIICRKIFSHILVHSAFTFIEMYTYLLRIY